MTREISEIFQYLVGKMSKSILTYYQIST